MKFCERKISFEFSIGIGRGEVIVFGDLRANNCNCEHCARATKTNLDH